MNSTVKNTLRNIIARYGTELSRNPRLCAAYLADLLPNHPVERQRLVDAVAQDLPRKLAQRHTKREREQLTHAFAQHSQLSGADAAQIVNAWVHALQGDSAPPSQSMSVGRSMPAYMGGVVTGLTALVVTSSIAFYQAPSEPMSAGAVSVVVATAAAVPVSTPAAAPAPIAQTSSQAQTPRPADIVRPEAA